MALNVLETFTVGGYEYQLRGVICGKPTCTKCPHGPYWYLTMKLRTGRRITKYLGKNLPEGVDQPC